ncbi:MAG TPA: hypothetical protein VFA89_00215 [Terriglobales bacterium]|nr:hypothetical protein [Terriglobales bacterium]
MPKTIEHPFDFRDSPFGLLISIRMGKVGIVAALQDGGALKLIGLPKCQKYPLHPIQFKELTALVFYKSSLLNRTPKFMVVNDGKGVVTILSPLAGMSRRPIFDDWDNAQYAAFLAAMREYPKSSSIFPQM